MMAAKALDERSGGKACKPSSATANIANAPPTTSRRGQAVARVLDGQILGKQRVILGQMNREDTRVGDHGDDQEGPTWACPPHSGDQSIRLTIGTRECRLPRLSPPTRTAIAVSTRRAIPDTTAAGAQHPGRPHPTRTGGAVPFSSCGGEFGQSETAN
jgi:hypothetical protein